MRLFGRDITRSQIAGVALGALAVLALVLQRVLPDPTRPPEETAAAPVDLDALDLTRYTIGHELAGPDVVLAHVPGTGWAMVEDAGTMPDLEFGTMYLTPPGSPLNWTTRSESSFAREIEEVEAEGRALIAGFDRAGRLTAFWHAMFPDDPFDLRAVAAAGRPVSVDAERLPLADLDARLDELSKDETAERVFVTRLTDSAFSRSMTSPWTWVCNAGTPLTPSFLEAEIVAQTGADAAISIAHHAVDVGPTRMVPGPGTVSFEPRRIVAVGLRGKRELPADIYCPARYSLTVTCPDAATCDRLDEVDLSGITDPLRDEAVLEEAIARSTPAGALARTQASLDELRDAGFAWTETRKGEAHLTIVRPLP